MVIYHSRIGALARALLATDFLSDLVPAPIYALYARCALNKSNPFLAACFYPLQTDARGTARLGPPSLCVVYRFSNCALTAILSSSLAREFSADAGIP